MDVFLQEIGQNLQEESADLAKYIEPEHKLLAARTYECMANCFRSPAPASDCQTCATQCNTRILQFQQDLETHVKTLQTGFHSCMQDCALKIVQDDGEELKSCVKDCLQTTVTKFAETRVVVKEIASKYQQ